uniref:phenylalanine--tRNA ligase n=1 Tax=Strigamia maritima TaxID=126957 RepID=T1JLJ6_STRMM
MAKHYLMNAKRIASFIIQRPRLYSQEPAKLKSVEINAKESITINKISYPRDEWSNTSQKIISYIGQNLHSQPKHPLQGNPIFSIYDNISPIVSVKQNFDQLLVAEDHPSRKKSDTYYINSEYVLRSQTSAHQHQLIKAGLDKFLCIGDVYRKDAIDKHHFPVFHQVEAVKLFTENELYYDKQNHADLKLFELRSNRTPDKQASHTLEAAKLVEHSLKSCLVELSQNIFGNDVKYRWSDSFFPFTHPSFELELYLNNEWVEMLGCGIIEQQILRNAGVDNKIGWAFGVGLDRLAMKLYEIPDIRTLWSKDTGFLSQFSKADPNTPIKYKPVSVYPQCINDMSFWISDKFTCNDFYEMVRHVGGEAIEQVTLFDQFTHPKNKRTSHAYRLVYRDMNRTLTQKEVNIIHRKIAEVAIREFGNKQKKLFKLIILRTHSKEHAPMF